MKRLLLLVVIPVVAIVAVAVFYLKGGRYAETDNAYVQSDMILMSTEISGVVKQVMATENQAVAAGQPLFRLDTVPLQVAVNKAEAKLAQVRTDLAALRATYREKEAEIVLARTKFEFAQKTEARQSSLASKNVTSESNLDDSRQTTDLAQQQIDVLEQDRQRIAETLGGSIDTPVEQHPSYLSAAAELDQAKLDLARAEVRAPVAGIVSKLPKQGQYMTAGDTAMALVASGNVRIEANFTETELTYVHPGQPVSITIDTYPEKKWKGMVQSLSPATGAEFSVIPAQNATGNWVKIAQRVPVRITLETEPDGPQLRAGLSANVEIDTGHQRKLFGFSL
jgi:membrane fusion protein (multidrug efflux system)